MFLYLMLVKSSAFTVNHWLSLHITSGLKGKTQSCKYLSRSEREINMYRIKLECVNPLMSSLSIDRAYFELLSCIFLKIVELNLPELSLCCAKSECIICQFSGFWCFYHEVLWKKALFLIIIVQGNERIRIKKERQHFFIAFSVCFYTVKKF